MRSSLRIILRLRMIYVESVLASILMTLEFFPTMNGNINIYEAHCLTSRYEICQG